MSQQEMMQNGLSNPPQTKSTLGILSLVFGGLAFLISWIPLVGMLGLPLSLLGLLLAIVGVIKTASQRSSGFTLSIGGGVISLFALLIISLQFLAVGAAGVAMNEASKVLKSEMRDVSSLDSSKSLPSNSGDDDSITDLENSILDSSESFMRKVEKKVAQDAIKQYNIAKQHGGAIDAYVHAGMVAAAFLQAKDEVNYKKWKKIEEQEAERAGLSNGF